MAANGLTDEDAEDYAEKVEPSCPRCARVQAKAADLVMAATEIRTNEIKRLTRELAAARAQLTALTTAPVMLTAEEDESLKAYAAELNAEAAKGCLVVGKVYRHPKSSRLLRVTDGSFLGGYQRVSNFWTWRYLDEKFQLAGGAGQGYGWKAEPVDEPEPCDHCGLLPNQQSDADEQCRVCGKGDDR